MHHWPQGGHPSTPVLSTPQLRAPPGSAPLRQASETIPAERKTQFGFYFKKPLLHPAGTSLKHSGHGCYS